MQTTNTAAITGRALPPPLVLAADMPSRWNDDELDFDSAADRIVRAHERDGDHRDLPISDLKTWAVVPHEGQFALAPLARHHGPKPLRANAFANLAARVGAPGDFIKRLPAPLQLATMNYLLAEHQESSAATLRVRGEEVAAIVSGRYAPLDPVELVETIREALVKHGMLREVRVRGVASGLVDNLRLVFPAEQKAIKPGDVSALGLDITSSSFARSAVHVSPVIWRLVCSNGLKKAERGSGFSFRHIGDSQRLRDGVAEAIPSAVVRARGVMDQWQRAVTFMVEDVQRQIESMRELTTPEKKLLEHELLKEIGAPALPEHVPLYDLVNALTASAKEASPARRLDIESIAGDVLSRHVGRA
ncbi:MAG: DUF932 domain-containing protein [Deltaproteobacteria bacterium]|nr:DUF932 domain-containing protein [Deltaproteobacteria bacterium]